MGLLILFEAGNVGPEPDVMFCYKTEISQQTIPTFHQPQTTGRPRNKPLLG